jgi:hypothetical protein
MSLSQTAQAIMNLRSSAPVAGEELVNIINVMKKSLSAGSTAEGGSHPERRGHAGGSFRNFSSSDGGGSGGRSRPSSNNNGWKGNSSSSQQYPTWNGSRRENKTASTSETAAASIPLTDTVAAPAEDGWRPVGKRFPNSRPSVSNNNASSSPPIAMYKHNKSNKPKEEVILNTVILGKLNKFSEDNFEDVRDFLRQILDGDQKDFLRAFMKLVFEKAAMESNFCPLYAKLLGSLVIEHPVILEEMNSLHSKYLEIFSGIKPKSDDYDIFVEENKKKAYRLGYSQFLGELIKQDILNREVLFTLIRNILDNIKAIECEENQNEMVEEYTDCLLGLLKAFIDRKTTTLRGEIRGEFNEQIRQLSTKRPETKSIPPKARFGFMDCLDILNK